MADREEMEFDVVIVGAGPSGLATAIRLAQLGKEAGRELNICVVEKGSEVGAHILSGAVFETRALDELIPDWRDKGAPLDVPVKDEKFLFLGKRRALSVPTWLLPPETQNHGNYIISLGNLCRWLGQQAEALGVSVFAGFPAADLLLEDATVRGVITADMGRARNGSEKSAFRRELLCEPNGLFLLRGVAAHLRTSWRKLLICAKNLTRRPTALALKSFGS